eukprot:Gb_08251 [translate_table: standard]
MHTGGGFGIGEGGDFHGRRVGGGGWDSNHRDAYFIKMLEANPGNPLLLRNYVHFLHEVQHDLRKAQEYYERAILASPDEAYLGSHHQSSLWSGLAAGDFEPMMVRSAKLLKEKMICQAERFWSAASERFPPTAGEWITSSIPLELHSKQHYKGPTPWAYIPSLENQEFNQARDSAYHGSLNSNHFPRKQYIDPNAIGR